MDDKDKNIDDLTETGSKNDKDDEDPKESKALKVWYFIYTIARASYSLLSLAI